MSTMAQTTSSRQVESSHKTRQSSTSSHNSPVEDGNNNITSKNGSSNCTRNSANGPASSSSSASITYDEETIDGFTILSFNTLHDLLEYSKKGANKQLATSNVSQEHLSHGEAKKCASNNRTSDPSASTRTDTRASIESNVKSTLRDHKTSHSITTKDANKGTVTNEEAETAFWYLNQKTIRDRQERCTPRHVSVIMDKPYSKFSTSVVQQPQIINDTSNGNVTKSLSLLKDVKATPVVTSSSETSRKQNGKKSATKRSQITLENEGDGKDASNSSPVNRKKSRSVADVASMIIRHSKRDIRPPARYHNSGIMVEGIGNQWVCSGPEKVPDKKVAKNRLAEEQKRIRRLQKPSLVPVAPSPGGANEEIAKPLHNPATTSSAPVSVQHKDSPRILVTPSAVFRNNSGPREKTVLPRKNFLTGQKCFSSLSLNSTSNPSSTITSASSCSSSSSSHSLLAKTEPQLTSTSGGVESKKAVAVQVNEKNVVNKIINRDVGSLRQSTTTASTTTAPQTVTTIGSSSKSSSSSSSSSKDALKALHELYRSLFMECKPERKLHYQRKGIKPRVNKLLAVEEAITVIKKHQRRAKQLDYIHKLLSLWHKKLDVCHKVITKQVVPEPNSKKDIITVVTDVLEAYQGSVCYRFLNNAHSASSSPSSTSSEISGQLTLRFISSSCSNCRLFSSTVTRDTVQHANCGTKDSCSFPSRKSASFSSSLSSPSSSSSSSSSSTVTQRDISNGHIKKSVSKSPSVNPKPYTLKVSLPNNEASSQMKEQVMTSTRPTLIANKPKSVQAVLNQPSPPIHTLNGSGLNNKRRKQPSVLAPRKVTSTASPPVPGAHENHDPTIGPSKKDSSTFNSSTMNVRKDLVSKMTPPTEAVLSVNGQRVAINNGQVPNLGLHWKDNPLLLIPHPPHLSSPTASGSATL